MFIINNFISPIKSYVRSCYFGLGVGLKNLVLFTSLIRVSLTQYRLSDNK